MSKIQWIGPDRTLGVTQSGHIVAGPPIEEPSALDVATDRALKAYEYELSERSLRGCAIDERELMKAAVAGALGLPNPFERASA